MDGWTSGWINPYIDKNEVRLFLIVTNALKKIEQGRVPSGWKWRATSVGVIREDLSRDLSTSPVLSTTQVSDYFSLFLMK